MLAEYRAVLSRPKFRAVIAPPMIEQLVSGLIASGEKIDALSAGVDLPDPDDTPFLEVALIGRADALVTGNARYFHPHKALPSSRTQTTQLTMRNKGEMVRAAL